MSFIINGLHLCFLKGCRETTTKRFPPNTVSGFFALLRTKRAIKIGAMITHICDRCSKPIFKGELRYIARIEVFAAPDAGEITIADLLSDQASEIDRLIKACEKMTEEELMRDVHVLREFDLCRACQKEFVLQPLGD